MKIPPWLVATCERDPDHSSWLAALPATIHELQRRWELELADPFVGVEGTCAWVAPSVRADGTHVVLKVGLPHMEAAHEHQGLRYWNGDPTVRLLEGDPDLGAMLLEQCEPGTPLRSLPEPDQDEVLADLLRRLWARTDAADVAALSTYPFRKLEEMLQLWSMESCAESDRWPDGGLVRQGLDLFETLPATADQEALLATDAHAGNVLRANRRPWILIDPKPFVGDVAYDATQHLFNCRERLWSRPRETIRRYAGLLGIDEERVRLWAFARAVVAPGDGWVDGGWISFARSIAP